MVQLWAAVAFESAWQAVAVSAIVLTAVSLGRRWPAALREGLLATALVKFLMPPFLNSPTGVLAAAAELIRVPSTAAVAASPLDGAALASGTVMLKIFLAVHIAGLLGILWRARMGLDAFAGGARVRLPLP